MAKYNKLIVAVLVPVGGLILNALGIDMAFGEEQANSLLAVVIPIVTAIGVWFAPNSG